MQPPTVELAGILQRRKGLFRCVVVIMCRTPRRLLATGRIRGAGRLTDSRTRAYCQAVACLQSTRRHFRRREYTVRRFQRLQGFHKFSAALISACNLLDLLRPLHSRHIKAGPRHGPCADASNHVPTPRQRRSMTPLEWRDYPPVQAVPPRWNMTIRRPLHLGFR